MKIELTIEDVLKNDTVYLTVKEVCKLTGVTKSTLLLHVQKDFIDGYEFKSKVFFTPDDVAKYKRLHDSGVLGRERGPRS